MTFSRGLIVGWTCAVLGCLIVGFMIGWTVHGARADTPPCVQAVRLLDTQDLLGPANAGTRVAYLKAHDACVREN